jgi:uncharacterized membrane protein YkvI
MLILSVIIGAGFASGQEVVTSFAQYGFISLFFLILLFFLFFKGLSLFLQFGNKYSNDFIKNNKFFKIFESLSLVIFLIIGSAMLAGVDDLLSEVFYDFSFPLWGLLAILFSSLILFFGFKTLLNISTYLVPCMIVGIVFICIKGNSVSTLSAPAFSSDFLNVFILFLSTISYGCCNLVLSNKFIFALGKKLNNKQIKYIALIVALSITLIVGIIAISILINDNITLYDELPLLHMAFLINKSMGYLFSIVILISILTTLFAAQYSFNEILKVKNKFLVFGISITSFFCISLFGFSEIVKYLYPVIGALGFLMLFYLKSLSPKSRFNKTNNEVHSPR